MLTLGYMTNAFGPLVGTGGGVTSMKEVGYLTMAPEEEQIEKVSQKGYRYFEMFEANILRYEQDPQAFIDMMQRHSCQLLGVYAGCHFIYPDALPDELAKIDRVAALAKKLGAKHIVLGGGSLRAAGIQPGDYALLASGIDQAAKVVESHGLTPSYHPHLGSLAEKPEQIHKLFSLTNVKFCPDIAHLIAGGSDAMELLKEYYPRISYVHLKDIDEAGTFVPLGQGRANIKGLVEFMLAQGYQGDWLVEIDGYPGDPDEACRQSYEFLQGILI